MTSQPVMYRTGDLVRWRADGELDYLGRADDQVKVRGFRIELGEIEWQLRRLEGVRDAVVVAAGEAGAKRLVAYVVLDADVAASRNWTERLRAGLAGVLPEHGVPSLYMCLDALPLTPNGKVDKRALPAIDLGDQLDRGHVAPRNPTERTLCTVWAELLGLDRVGVEDNFFAIGGDSIVAIQAVARANQAGIAITTRQVFEAQTIAKLALLAMSAGARQFAQAAVVGELTLLPIQRRFLEGDATDRHHFNQALLLDAPADFSLADVRPLLDALIRRHDALRLRFVETADGWRAQHVGFGDAEIDACLVRESVPAESGDAFVTSRCAYWQASLDLANGPLLRAVVFDGGERTRLLLIVHHLVVDGVSWRVLLADLELGYAQLRAGEPVALAPKTSSLQDWGQALAAYAHGATLARERGYWLAQAQLPVAPLPQDFAIEEVPSLATSASVAIRLDAADTDALLRRCAATYRTQINELLLAGVYLGLRAWSGTARLRIALEGHGREDIDDSIDLSQTVGWFTTLYPLVLESADTDVGATIKAVKEQYRALPRNGLGHGVLRDVLGEAQLRAAGQDDGAALLFNYLGQFDQALSATGPFAVSRLGAGSSVSARRARDHRFELNGQISGGVLQFMLDYSRAQYRDETAQALADAIGQGLRAVIAHCQAPQAHTLTPSDFPLAQVAAPQLDDWQRRYAIRRLYPAAPMQTGMLFHSRLDPTAYVMQACPVLEGPLDVATFRAAWQSLVARHDIFRTAFVGEEGELHQLVAESAELPWDERDWRGLDAAQQAQHLAELRLADQLRGFDLAAPPLMRVAVLRLAETRYQLLWTYHHLLVDGWCIPLIYREVLQNYQTALGGVPAPLQEAPAYENYLAWIARQDPAAARDYWRARVGDIEAPTPLAIDELGATNAHGRRVRSVVLDVQQTRRLQDWARRQQGTISSAVQLAWAYLLHRYSREDSVVFGATFAGRPAAVAGIEEMLGLFINTLPVRVDFEATASAASLLRSLQKEFQRSQDYGFLPLAQIQQQSRVPGGTPLFQSLLVFENYPVDAALKAATGDLRIVDDSDQADDLVSGYTLNLAALLTNELTIHCGYAAEKLADATVERLLAQLALVLNALPDSADDEPFAVDIAQEDRAQLESWNATDVEFSDAAGLVRVQSLFERQALARPQAIAVVDARTRLTYGELDAAANRVAHALRSHGAARGEIVALCVDRSVQVLVGLLGALKAGAAYVPIDPAYPPDRLRYMLEDSGARQVLSVSSVASAIDFGTRRVHRLDDAAAFDAFDTTRPELDGAAIDDLACLIYTSGSTGRPKGVMLVHRGPINMAMNQRRLFTPDADSRVLQFASISFDALTWDWAMALCNGGALHIVNDEVRHSPALLGDYLVDHAITHATLPPAVLPQMDETRPYALRALIVAGEACEPGLAWRWAARVPLFNGYGPTENTVCASITPVRVGQRPRIGVPIGNVRLDVLDARGALQPIGVPGELYIAGESLARGYWNRADLTNATFVTDANVAARRRYRSGDIVRWLPDGELEYLGRADHQIKIRGYRVELGEIEAQLARGDGVREAVVVAQDGDDGSRRLVAYVTGQISDTAGLRQQLAQSLPEHMLPAAIVVLDALPLTPNGKLDRRALPRMDIASLHEYVAPESETEIRLADLWCRLLQLPQVSVEANFFEVGGHSLLVTRMAAEFRRDLPFEIPLTEIFKHKTIRSLARQIDLLAAEQSLRNDIAFDAPTSDSDNGLIEL